MELLIFIIFVFLIVILYKQGQGFAKLHSEMDAVKRQLDLLMKKEEEIVPGCISSDSGRPVKAVSEENAISDFPEEETEAIPVEESEKYRNTGLLETFVSEEPEVSEEIIAWNTVPSVSAEETTPVATKKEKRNRNYEKFIGENLFGKVGILVLVIGVGFFVKYAIDKDWINETMRTIMGFVIGSVLLIIAERLRDKYRAFSSLLTGGAFAVFYLTVTIAFHYYHLFSQTSAFLILVFLTLCMSVLAVLYDRRELAIVALAGGFIAPFLVSNGEGNYIALFTYLTILNLGMFGLSLYKKWAELPLISFAATYLIFLIYVVTEVLLNYVPQSELTVRSMYLLSFATAFYFIFLLPVLTILKSEGKKLSKWLLTIVVANNFLYLTGGLLFLNSMNLPVKMTGAFTLFIAVVNLLLVVWLRKSRQDRKPLIYALLALVITFVSLTIPVQLEGNYITLFWASEMVILLWLYIKSRIRLYESASFILMALTFVSYLTDIETQWIAFDVQGLDSYISDCRPDCDMFLNGMFVTGIYTGLAAMVFALLLARYRSVMDSARFLKYYPWNALMLVASVAIIYYTFMAEFHFCLSPELSPEVMRLFTAGCILAACYLFRKRFPVNKYSLSYFIAIGANVILCLFSVGSDAGEDTFYLLSWLTIITGVANLMYVGKLYYACHKETARFTIYISVLSTLLWIGIVSLFLCQCGLPDEYNAGFSIALAVAGFVQMSLGMRLHQKVLRMVSLGTLGIVLVKLVLVDLWAMPTIGKIVVFIILGVILLVLSFLYQKLKDVLFKDDEEDTL